MATTTAGDFTVEMKIDPDGYRAWYNMHYENGGDFKRNLGPAYSLTNFLTKEIEEELTQNMRTRSLSHSAIEKPIDVNIADIVFSFNN